MENAALYYLQRYASSAENLRRVLGRKIKRSCAFHGDDPAPFAGLVDDLIARYTASGLLDDQSFARARVTSLRRQGLSARAIAAKLQPKGLSPRQIAAALAMVDGEAEEPDLAAAVAYARRKKLGPFRTRPQDPKKELAAMARAGFDFETARRALDADIDLEN